MRGKLSTAAVAAAGLAFMLCLYFFCAWALELLHARFPASLTAMVLLFALLCLKIVPLWLVESAANLLLKNMVFYFVPLLAVLPASYDTYKDHLWGIMGALIASGVLTLAATELAAEKLAGKGEKNKPEKEARDV